MSKIVIDGSGPEPSELRVFRFDFTQGGPTTQSYVVPTGKVLIINAWTLGRMNSNLNVRLLRNTDPVAERATNLPTDAGGFNVVFPTGVAFFAGDSFTVDSGFNSTVVYAYGYERDA